MMGMPRIWPQAKPRISTEARPRKHHLPSEFGSLSDGPGPRGRTIGREGCLIRIRDNTEPIPGTAGITHRLVRPEPLRQSSTAITSGVTRNLAMRSNPLMRAQPSLRSGPASGAARPPGSLTRVTQPRAADRIPVCTGWASNPVESGFVEDGLSRERLSRKDRQQLPLTYNRHCEIAPTVSGVSEVECARGRS
jgi:hypothetical protein